MMREMFSIPEGNDEEACKCSWIASIWSTPS